jgi:hypothetical protein
MGRTESVHEKEIRASFWHLRGWKTENEMVENHENMMYINEYFTFEL